jgi:heme A synthase
LLLPWWISTSHACLAQLFFSTTVAMAVFTSRWWLQGASEMEEDPKYPIRGLSLAAPLCVLGQLFLGAAVRHKALGSIYHIAGAPIVCAVILWVSLRILLHYAQNRELRLASLALIGITFTQVFLGIAAYMSRIAYADAVQPMPLMVTFTVRGRPDHGRQRRPGHSGTAQRSGAGPGIRGLGSRGPLLSHAPLHSPHQAAHHLAHPHEHGRGLFFRAETRL